MGERVEIEHDTPFQVVLTVGSRTVAIGSSLLTDTQRAAVLYICTRAGQEPVPPAARQGPQAQMEQNREAARDYTRRLEARAQGFVGEPCACGSLNTKRNGSCLVCTDCGNTTGCS